MGRALQKLFNKVTLRSHYQQQYNNLLFDLIESQYAPEVWTDKITLRNKHINVPGPLIIIAERVEFIGASSLTLGTSLTVGRKK